MTREELQEKFELTCLVAIFCLSLFGGKSFTMRYIILGLIVIPWEVGLFLLLGLSL